MRKSMTWFLVLTLATPVALAGIDDEAFRAKGETLCAALTVTPELDFDAVFSEAAHDVITAAEFSRYLAGFAQEFGACTRSTLLALPEPDERVRWLRFDTDAGGILFAQVTLDDQALVDGFRVADARDPRVRAATPAALAQMLQALGGRTSFYLAMDGGPGAAGQLEADEPMAIGSSFKLWILGALAASVPAQLAWTTPLAIKEAWKSLPSGEMHTWPDGAEVSVFEFARKMIYESDNTAADHLLRYLGRDTVAAMAREMGLANDHPGNAPLLTTVEMFKLKWLNDDATRAERYARGDVAEREAILAELAAKPRTEVCQETRCFLTPTFIEQIEWFASTSETCAAMRWLAARRETHLDEILGANTPFLQLRAEDGHWAWAGYKGGSEPGVLHMTYGLRAKSGVTGCLSLGWNDPSIDLYAAAAKEQKFFALAAEALRLAEGVIP